MKIVDVLQQKMDLRFMAGVSEEKILEVEKNMKLNFSKEYKEFLKIFGAVAFDSHEIVGICSSDRLNVEIVTFQQRKLQIDIPETWYVIEEKNIDDVVVWQAPDGSIYQTSPRAVPQKLCNSLCEYVEM